jgi:hypothetical protein
MAAVSGSTFPPRLRRSESHLLLWPLLLFHCAVANAASHDVQSPLHSEKASNVTNDFLVDEGGSSSIGSVRELDRAGPASLRQRSPFSDDSMKNRYVGRAVLGFSSKGQWEVLGSGWNAKANGPVGTARVVDEIAGFPPSLIVSYPGGDYGFGRFEGGLQFDSHPLPDSLRMRLSYSLYVPAGFDWVRGGKLPGLFGGRSLSGGDNEGLGVDGMSIRLHWRSGGEIHAYGYIPSNNDPRFCRLPGIDCNEAYGVGILRNTFWLIPGQWNTIVLEATMNDIGENNGIVTMQVNGKSGSFGTAVFRLSSDLLFSGVFFSTFFGGHDESWAPPVDQELGFRDFVLESW